MGSRSQVVGKGCRIDEVSQLAGSVWTVSLSISTHAAIPVHAPVARASRVIFPFSLSQLDSALSRVLLRVPARGKCV